MEIYPDPLRKGGKQACIWTQLVCATCARDLTAARTPGIIDIESGKAYCGTEHYEMRERRKT